MLKSKIISNVIGKGEYESLDIRAGRGKTLVILRISPDNNKLPVRMHMNMVLIQNANGEDTFSIKESAEGAGLLKEKTYKGSFKGDFVFDAEKDYNDSVVDLKVPRFEYEDSDGKHHIDVNVEAWTLEEMDCTGMTVTVVRDGVSV